MGLNEIVLYLLISFFFPKVPLLSSFLLFIIFFSPPTVVLLVGREPWMEAFVCSKMDFNPKVTWA